MKRKSRNLLKLLLKKNNILPSNVDNNVNDKQILTTNICKSTDEGNFYSLNYYSPANGSNDSDSKNKNLKLDLEDSVSYSFSDDERKNNKEKKELWEASFRITKAFTKDELKSFFSMESLENKKGEMELFNDTNFIDNEVQKLIQKRVFQMYCSTVQCTICLSSLSNSGTKFSVRAAQKKTDDIDLFFYINFTSKRPNEQINQVVRPTSSHSESNENNGNDENENPLSKQRHHANDLHDNDIMNNVSIACLPCGHKFCTSCITYLIDHKAETVHGSIQQAPPKMRIRCPLCRRKVKITSVSYFTV